MESLFNTIKSHHGRDMQNNALNFEKMRMSRARILSNLIFLKQCRDENLTPKFAKCSHPLNRGRNISLFNKLSKTLIKHEIKFARFQLIKTSKNLLGLHLLLCSTLSFDLWRNLDALTYAKAEKFLNFSLANKTRKLNSLRNFNLINNYVYSPLYRQSPCALPNPRIHEVYNAQDLHLNSNLEMSTSSNLTQHNNVSSNMLGPRINLNLSSNPSISKMQELLNTSTQLGSLIPTQECAGQTSSQFEVSCIPTQEHINVHTQFIDHVSA